MNEIWVVSSGEYSDYRVLAAFDSKERAEAASKMRAADGWREEYRVESLPYFDREPTAITTHLITTEVWDDGTADEPKATARTELEFDMLWQERRKPVGWRWVRAPIHAGKGGRLDVYGTDLKRVQKVFSDTRARLLADDVLRLKREATG